MVEPRQLRPVQPQCEMCEDPPVARSAAAPQTDFLIGLPLACNYLNKLPGSNCLCCSRERLRIGSADSPIDTADADRGNLVFCKAKLLKRCMRIAVLALKAARAKIVRLSCLTFELSGRQWQDAKPGLAKMYRVPPARDWWPAIGAPLERGVRPHCAAEEDRDPQ